MNKTELIWAISDQTDIPSDAADRMLKAAADTIAGALANGEEVVIPGFGTFTRKTMSARKGRNLHTGAMIDIPARTLPAFRPGKKLKDAVRAE